MHKCYIFYSVKVVKRKDRLVGSKTIRKAPVKQIRLARISDSQNGTQKVYIVLIVGPVFIYDITHQPVVCRRLDTETTTVTYSADPHKRAHESIHSSFSNR